MSQIMETRMNDARNDAEIFSLLAAFYNFNPTSKAVSAMRNLDPEGIEDSEVSEAVRKIRDHAMNTVTDDENESMLDIRRDWTKLFRGVAPDYGPQAPYEGLYKGEKGQKLLSDLASTYICKGYSEFGKMNNRQDYLGIELSFVAFLCLLRQNAAENGDKTACDKLTDTVEEFLSLHIRPWFGSFREEALKHVKTDYFKGVLDLTDLILQ